MRNKAFTLIEIMVATSILLLLAGLFFFGGRYALESSRERQTRASLQLLESMLKDVNSKGGSAKIEAIYRTRFATATGTASIDALNPPLSPGQLYSWDGLVTTQRVMGALAGVPANASRLNAISADQKLRPDTEATAPGANDLSYLPATWGPTATFTPGILLDAWGSPIIYVPGRFTFTNDAGALVVMLPGIRNVTLASHASATEKHRITSAGFNEQATEATTTPPRQGTVGFFASAGPDGNFQTGEDNIYSYEN